MLKVKLLNITAFNKAVTRITYRGDITFLRSIAVLSVLFYHSEIKFFKGGWLGVDIFFVISGYLISNIIFSELSNGSFLFRNFIKRRVKRILPALMSTLLVTIPFSYFLLVPKELIEYARSLVSSLFFYSNYFFRNLDFYNSAPAKKMPLLHIWTLSLEEQFYILFPIFAFVTYKLLKNKSIFLIIFIFFASIFLNSTNQTNDKFYFLEYRAWEFLLGVLIMFLGYTFTVKNIKYLGLFTILFSIYHFDDSQINEIEPKIFVVVGTAIFLLFEGDNNFKRLENNSIIKQIGLSSFSIYLIHQPIFSFSRIYLERSNQYIDNIDRLTLILLSLIVGYYSWKHVEVYFQNIKSLKNLVIFIVITIFIIVSFFVYSENTSGIKNRYDFIPDEVLYYSLNTNFYPNSNIENLQNWKNFKCFDGTCNFTNNDNSKSIYIFGDSHANIFSVSVLRELNELSKEYDLKIKNGTGGRCLLSGQVDSTEYVGACERDYFEEFVKRITKDDIVVITGRLDLWINSEIGEKQLQCKTCDYKKELLERFEKLALSSKNLFIFYPHPTYEYSIAKSYLYKQNKWGEPIKLDYNLWNEYIEETELFFDSINGDNIVRIYSDEFFCNKFEQGYCYASTTNDIFYTDDNHLSFEGIYPLTQTLEKMILSSTIKNN